MVFSVSSAKVTGDTVYNMLRLTEVDIDADERPRNPHKIKSCEVGSVIIRGYSTEMVVEEELVTTPPFKAVR